MDLIDGEMLGARIENVAPLGNPQAPGKLTL